MREELAADALGPDGRGERRIRHGYRRRHVSIQVIERGVGWTLACGTGSVRDRGGRHREGFTGADVIVENPGGALRVSSTATSHAERPGAVRGNVEWLEA